MAKGDPPWMQDDLVWATIERQRRWRAEHPEPPGGKLNARDSWVYAYMARVGDPARPGGRGVVTESRKKMAAALGMGTRTLDDAITSLLQRGFIKAVGTPERGQTKTYKVIHPRDVVTSNDASSAQDQRRLAPEPAQTEVRDIRVGGARISQEGVRENGNLMTGVNDGILRTITPQSPPPREGGTEADMVEAPSWPWGDLSERMKTWRSAAGIPQTCAALLAGSNGYELDASQWGKYERGVPNEALDAIRSAIDREPTPEQAIEHQGDRSAAEVAAALFITAPEWSAVRNGIDPEHLMAVESVLAIEPATFTVPGDLPMRMKAFRAEQAANGKRSVALWAKDFGIAAHDWRKAENGDYVMPDVLEVIEAMLDGRLLRTRAQTRRHGRAPTKRYDQVVQVGIEPEYCGGLLDALPGWGLEHLLRAAIAVGQALADCGVRDNPLQKAGRTINDIPNGVRRIHHSTTIRPEQYGTGAKMGRAARSAMAIGLELLRRAVRSGVLGHGDKPILTNEGDLRQWLRLWVGEGEVDQRPTRFIWLDIETGQVSASTKDGPRTWPSEQALLDSVRGAVVGYHPQRPVIDPDPKGSIGRGWGGG